MLPVRELYDELPSTQDRALTLARSGAPEGSRVVARRQSRGRGRGDRSWDSPAGGLYLSVVVRTSRTSSLLPLAVGAELANALEEEFAVRLRLKWPNDLLAVDGAGVGRKLSGVLVDVVPGEGGHPCAVTGVGVNAHRPPTGSSPANRGTSATLEELTPQPIDLERLEEIVARAAVSAGRLLHDPRGDAVVVARCRGLLFGRGEAVTVDGAAAGTAVGVTDDGGLEVAGPDGTRVLHAGHVRVGVGG